MLEKLLVLSEAAWIHLLIQLTTLPAQLPALHTPSVSTAALPFLSVRLQAVVEALLQGSSLHVFQGSRLHVAEGSSLRLLLLPERDASFFGTAERWCQLGRHLIALCTCL